jgi:hypothetical protein
MRMKKLVAVAALSALSLTAWAQTPGAAAGTAPAPAATSAAKKQLVARLLEIQKAGIEALANNVAAAPAMQLRQQAGAALQSVPQERRETVAREMEADLRKYMDEVGPIVRQQAVRLAPGSVGTLMEERFSEEELRQLIAQLQSPSYLKYQSLAGELQRALGERLISETRSTVEPKVRDLERTLAGRLGLQQAPAGEAAPRN